jgi:hypothetical protein
MQAAGTRQSHKLREDKLPQKAQEALILFSGNRWFWLEAQRNVRSTMHRRQSSDRKLGSIPEADNFSSVSPYSTTGFSPGSSSFFPPSVSSTSRRASSPRPPEFASSYPPLAGPSYSTTSLSPGSSSFFPPSDSNVSSRQSGSAGRPRSSSVSLPHSMRPRTDAPASESLLTGMRKLDVGAAEPSMLQSSPSGNEFIEESERAKKAAFVKARARLAATLSGANVETLQDEINKAARNVKKWPGDSEGAVDEAEILRETIDEAYIRLHRFQTLDRHCVPQAEEDRMPAIDYLRSEPVRLRSDSERLERARLAADHMGGREYTPFVSLTENLGNVIKTKDKGSSSGYGEGGLTEIIENAEQIHTYTVPKAFTLKPEAVANVLDRGLEDERCYEWEKPDRDRARAKFLRRGPTAEAEVLFQGGNLGAYRTSKKHNPYKKPHKGR